MADNLSKIVYNSRERLTSTDLNAQIGFENRAIIESAVATGSDGGFVGGVINGFVPVASSATNTIAVGKGLGFIRDSSRLYPESQFEWIEIVDAVTVTIPSSTGFDRWDVIEVQPAFIVESTRVVDIFNPGTGLFEPMSENKEIKSEAIVIIRSGADNSPNPPNFPGGVQSGIPIAYLFVNADGTILGDGQRGLVMCRPMLANGEMTPGPTGVQTGVSPETGQDRTWIQGGGINVAFGGAFGGDPRINGCMGKFWESKKPFRIPHSTRLDATDTIVWDGNAISVAERNLYLYAVPPPYPVGYPSIASREFTVGDVAASKFKQTGSGLTMDGCIALISEKQPGGNVSPLDIRLQGAPSQDMTIYDWPFRNGTVGADVEFEDAVYLGAVDFDSSEIKAQTCTLDGHVTLTERAPYTDLAAILVSNLGSTSNNPRIPNGSPAAADRNGLIPAHIFDMTAVFNVEATSASDMFIEYQDTAAEAITNLDQKTIEFSNTVGGLRNYRQEVHLHLEEDNLDVIVSTGAGLGTIGDQGIWITAYTDQIIAGR